jgi:hypothetical protein
VATALLLYGILALSDSHVERSAWLIGAAIAVQPLVLLALPVVLAALEPRRMPSFLARAGAPGALLLGVAASADWHATFTAVTSQPNSPIVNHATPWTHLAPHLSNGAVAAGPERALAIVLACGCGLLLANRWRVGGRMVTTSPERLEELLWWAATTLAFRCVFEPVMVAFYLWPVLAVALIAASTGWWRLLATALAASAITFASQASWQRPSMIWWGSMVAGLGLTLFFAHPSPHRTPSPRGASAPGPASPLEAALCHGSHETRLRNST